MNKKILLLTLLLTISISIWSQVTIAAWDMSALTSYGPSPNAATTSNSNVVVGGLTRGAGVGTGGSAAARAWGGTDWDATSAAIGIANNVFATFTIKPNTGFKISLSAINPFDYRRSPTGATSGCIEYAINDGTYTVVTTVSFSSTSDSGASIGSTDLSGISALQNIPSTSTVTFRIIPYGASSAGGKWYIFDKGTSTTSDFTVTGFVAIDEPAPIELLSFKSFIERDAIYLNWQTASELNNDFFSIEHSKNGKEFSSIGKIPGNGTTTGTISYSYTDQSPTNGPNYYRLQQVDYDGSFTYSPIVSAYFAPGKDISVYPTLVGQEIHVGFSGDFSEEANVMVFDQMGRLVKVWKLSGDAQDNPLGVGDLDKGIYHLQVRTPGMNKTVKFFKQ